MRGVGAPGLVACSLSGAAHVALRTTGIGPARRSIAAGLTPGGATIAAITITITITIAVA